MKKNIWKKKNFPILRSRLWTPPRSPFPLQIWQKKMESSELKLQVFFFLVCSLFSILFCQSGSLPSERLPAMFHPSSISFHFSFVFRFSFFEAFSASSKCLSFFLLHNRGTFRFAESKVRIWFFFRLTHFLLKSKSKLKDTKVNEVNSNQMASENEG